MCLIRSPATSNANTVTMASASWATRPGWPLTVRSRSVKSGARLASSTTRCAISSPPSTGSRWAGNAASAVRDHRGVGIEQADEGADVLGFPRLLEVPDNVGLLGGGGRGSGRRADSVAGRGRQLAACRRGAADDRGYFGEGVAEDVVEDERDALGWGHRFEHDQKRHADRLIEGDPVGWVGHGAAGLCADPLTAFGQRLRDPWAHVAFPPGACRAEHVQADPAGDSGQPGGGRFDGLLPLRGHGVPPGVGLLHGIFGLGQGTEEPVGEIDQVSPLAHDLGWGGHGAAASLGRTCPHHFDETSHESVRS
jgi:hypothetical protein